MKKIFCFTGIFLAICIIFLLGCEKDEKVKTGAEELKPDVEAVFAEVHKDGGVTLVGTINKMPENVAYVGFIIATDSLFKHTVFRTLPTEPKGPGKFTAEMNFNLISREKYFFTTFSYHVNQSAKTYNVKSFVPYGSKKIEVKSVYPLKAAMGDTLTLKGKNFEPDYLFINFDDKPAYVRVLNDSLAITIVPLNLKRPNPVISNNSVEEQLVSKDFSLLAPVLSSFTSTASFRDTISIHGDYFGETPGSNEVWFGAIEANIVSNSRKLIKVIVPDNVEKMETVPSVRAQFQTVVAVSKFQIRKPELLAVPSSGFALDEITITGKNFHPFVHNNKVTFENTEAQMVSGSPNRMTLTIPAGPFPRRKAAIKLKLLDYQINYPIEMAVKDKWVVVNTIPFDDYQPIGAFTINNVSFAIADQKGTDKSYLWKFNLSNYTWERINIPFNSRDGVVSCNAEKAYVYLTRETDNFWEYNPVGNKWTKKKDHPGKSRSQPTTFTIDNRVYLGTGYHEDFGAHADNTFYQYNVNTDSWKRVADYPSPSEYSFRIGAAAFVLNKVGYVGCGDPGGAKSNFYRYDESNDKWIAIKDFRSIGMYGHSFSHNNYGYICGGGGRSCYRYDPVRDTWTLLKDPMGPEKTSPGIERSFAFVNNGFVYSGSGSSWSQGIGLLQARIDEL